MTRPHRWDLGSNVQVLHADVDGVALVAAVAALQSGLAGAIRQGVRQMDLAALAVVDLVHPGLLGRGDGGRGGEQQHFHGGAHIGGLPG